MEAGTLLALPASPLGLKVQREPRPDGSRDEFTKKNRAIRCFVQREPGPDGSRDLSVVTHRVAW